MYADDLQLLWYRDPDVLARSCTAHFHALYGEYEVQIDIRTLEVLRGHLPRRALGMVLEWVQEHRAELLENWEKCTRNMTLARIAPLK